MTMNFSSWFKSWWLPLWAFFVKVLKEVAAPVTDFADHLDGYKIGGFGAFAFAGWLAVQVIDLAKKADPSALTGLVSLSTLVTAFIAVGYFMFSHAKDVDKSLSQAQGVQPPLSRPQGGAPQ
jgi:hypothetical protein